MEDKELLPLLLPQPLPKSSRRHIWVAMALIQTLFTIAIVLLSVQHVFANPLPGQPFPRSSSEIHLHDHLGAVASESSICSQIGIDLLKEGGNAADAVRRRK